jgi:hypothetical protein
VRIIDKRQIQALLYEGLAPALPEFRLNKSEEAFWRAVPMGRQKLFVPVVDYRPEFVVSLTVGLRIDQVEDVFNLFSGAVGKDQKLTLTTIAPLDYFTGPEEAEYRVVEEAHVNAVVQRLKAVIETAIRPFLEEYQDVASIDRALNVEQRDRFDITAALSHAMHSVIVARLAGNTAYPELVRGYEEQLAGFLPQIKDQFTRLVAYLDDLQT